MNIQFAHSIIQKLVSHDIDTFCICPSSRNAPFVEVLTSSKELCLFHFFDERSAAFFAMGRAQRNRSPVVVVTTSGTAVCELLPAVCEAYYSATPLILLTADRPSSFKNSSAPQCIEQMGLFSNFVSHEWDLEELNDLDLSSWNFSTPIHINVRFDEPLLSSSPPLIKKTLKEKTVEKYFLKNAPVKDIEFFQTPFSKEFQNFFKKSQKPVVIVSELPLSLTEPVKSLLLKWKFPIYIEPLSQLRENPKLQPLRLKSEESILPKLFEKKLCDGVIRIGNTPVVRFWRDLNNKDIPVWSLNRLSFSGLKRKNNVTPLVQFLKTSQDIEFQTDFTKEVFKLDQSSKNSQTEELKWIHWLSEKIPQNSHIFLGNSLPIREWSSQATQKNKDFIYSGNRGANGIDGILSSFLGLLSQTRKNYCILGDLSLLYDLSAFWALNQLKEYSITFIVINNFGGQIFKDKFKNPYYLNSHQINFEHLAYLWKINYQKLNSFNNSLTSISPSLIEIQIHS